MTSIVTGSCLDYRDEVDPLLVDHWREVAKNKALMVLDPDWAKYESIEEAGKLLTIFAFDNMARLVGYASTIIDNHLHYKGLVVASNDVLFVSNQARGNVGLLLMRETETQARARGAKMMLWHAKQGSALDRILQRKRLNVQDILYSKEL